MGQTISAITWFIHNEPEEEEHDDIGKDLAVFVYDTESEEDGYKSLSE